MCFFIKHSAEYLYLHNHEVYMSFPFWIMSNIIKVPEMIIHCHATKFSDQKLAAIRNRILCMPIHFMRCRRVACSRAAGEFLYGKRACHKGMVTVFYNATDSKRYQFDIKKRNAWRKQLGITEDQIVLGHVGRFVNQKNHKFLLRIFKECLFFSVNPILLCIGDGPLRKQIEKTAEEMGISEYINFMGQRKDVAELLSVMDVLLLPSLFEGFPVVLVEAISNGLNCLISNEVSDEIECDKFEFMSLNCSPREWAAKAVNLSKRVRKSDENINQFNIEIQAKRLQLFYLDELSMKGIK